MRCQNCNMEIAENMNNCPNCGMSVNNVNSNTVNGTGVDPNFNQMNYQNNVTVQNTSVPTEDKVNVGLVILSFFIPLAGLIIFFVKKKTSPKTANASGICALISFVINLVVMFFMFSVIFTVANNALEDSYDVLEENVEIVDDTDNLEEDNTGSTITSGVSADWKNYQVTFNNQTISLPTAYGSFASTTGFSLKDSDSKSYLDNNYYSIVNMYVGDKLALSIELLNDTGASALYTDCKVTRVSQTKYQVVTNGATAFVFPGGLKAGDSITEDQITTLFGTPSDIYEYNSDSYSTKTYSYCSDSTWTTTNYYKIKVVNGVIDELTLDHRN